ncbi:FecR domain-containing protein [Rhodopirellula bahusiensis]|uniref:Iron dicitrate transport regulator FecR n=1 Tax=Rhodopirellula bahusiensis TaxID=2014065 RepID=A0A2G1VYC7_9BACT|nr:FecR domain-containing protein [Rhodopirellula bahusiensis]PHQ31767.1 iron dicitrate transport regulator FecR [Rhodopirellula bahusiensis]
MTQRERFNELRDAFLDGVASPAETEELQRLLHSSDEWLDDYIEHANQDAALIWNGIPNRPSPTVHPTTSAAGTSRFVRYMPLIAASLLFVAAVGWEWMTLKPRSVATILSSTDCHWGTGTLPTTVGQELTSGRLRLISGIAELQFPHATVSMEGPVDIELISAERCRLHSGSIVGSVSDGGEGFVVETPRAEITDRGTKFGVFVDNVGDARLDVLEGKVDVKHTKTGRQLTLEGASRAFASVHALETFAPKKEGEDQQNAMTPTTLDKVLHISSAYGDGDEGDVTSGERREGDSFPTPDHVLLVKRADSEPHWNRKAFIRFDLQGLEISELSGVELRLEGVHTRMGYTSLLPDSTFHIYGVKPEHNTDWNSQTLDRSNFPGRKLKTHKLDPDKVQLLGEFVIPQSKPQGQFVIADPRLQQFLQDNLGSTPTLVITRLTSVNQTQSYVHGFASRTHPTASPPTLRLHVKQTVSN